ncbi:MAG: 6-phosphofructokinase [Chloroflexi bacterium]|nr:6-phosphofructokinase [Chloroflexota bacterium]
MKKIGVLTSGGDAPGMNAAVRAVVRAGLDQGAEVYAIFDGYRGMVEPDGRIQKMTWQDVGGILQQGGTIIGTARCRQFRERNGRLIAARRLLEHSIDSLVIIGGDGSLTGAHILHQEWPELAAELIESGQITPEQAAGHEELTIVGLVGSIDNDMWGTDISIGADTALHRITDAVDDIASTAASHQRAFVIEVMGRNCGYLALMSAIAAGADWVLIPESPPDLDDWEGKMCSVLAKGREIGRRDSIVIVSEGARDRRGQHISSEYVRQVLEERLGEDARVTILGHVQRGGSPSVFDRNLSTRMGVRAVEVILSPETEGKALVIGLKGNRLENLPLDLCLEKTQEIRTAVKNNEYKQVMQLRGRSFQESFQAVRTLVRALPHEPNPEKPGLRIGVLNSGACAPGMNTMVRAAVRLGIDRGHTLLGIRNGFRGLRDGEVEEMDWMSVNGWVGIGGAEIGTNRHTPKHSDFYAIARTIEDNRIEALFVIGGWAAYKSALDLYDQRKNFPAFDIPILCFPATIDNNLPGTELSVGADTALNNIIDAVDKIKQSAVAARRVFVVEVMGGMCGYLALMGALATGAERVYLNEEGITLTELAADVQKLIRGFQGGKRLGVAIRNEKANPTYTLDFIRALYAEEGKGYFSVRQASLGHLQQGGNPSPYDRILGTELITEGLIYLEEQMQQPEPASACVGLLRGAYEITPFEDLPRLMDFEHARPKKEWWLSLRPLARMMARPAPASANVIPNPAG